MMIAKEYGQDPRSVAEWEPEWLAAASIWIEARSGAEAEIRAREARRAKMARSRRGA